MNPPPRLSARAKAYEIIFGADTPPGKRFDLFLIAAIVISTTLNALDTVDSLRAAHGPLFRSLEWGFTVLFIGYAIIAGPTGIVSAEFIRDGGPLPPKDSL